MKTEVGRNWYQSIHFDNCLVGKSPFPDPNGHHHERSINVLSVFIVHFDTVPNNT